VCHYEGGLVRISLADGKVESSEMPCFGVAVDDQGRLVVAAPAAAGDYYGGALYAFASWEDALAGRVEVTYPGGAAFVERFTIHAGVLYRSWHSTNTIERYELHSGTTLEPILLDGYDGWILGLSVTGDGRLFVPGDLWGSTVWVFDATSGAVEGVVAPSTPVEGIACVDRQ